MVGVTVDPNDPNVLFVAVQDTGIWKSCDAGATWNRVGSPNTDPDPWDATSNYLDVPFEIAIDPEDSKHMYATDGVRGTFDMGFWISTDGGALWRRTDAFRTAAMTTSADTTDMAVDPADFNHVLVATHTEWQGQKGAGVMETPDGGFTWILHPPEPTWPSGTNGIEFLFDPIAKVGDKNTWLNMTSGDGFWRTTDAGANWTKVAPMYTSIHGLGVVYRAKSGVLYAGANNNPMRSKDNGFTWTQDLVGLPTTYYYVVGGDGTNLFTARSLNYGAQPFNPFFTSPDGDGTTWTQFGKGGTDQTFSDGPIVMKYDPKNHIVYAACWKAGLLALKTAL